MYCSESESPFCLGQAGTPIMIYQCQWPPAGVLLQVVVQAISSSNTTTTRSSNTTTTSSSRLVLIIQMRYTLRLPSRPLHIGRKKANSF